MNWKVAPRSALGVAQSPPPCSSAIERLMAKPINPYPCLPLLLCKGLDFAISAHWAIVRGWAESHYLRSFGLMPAGAVLVYRPMPLAWYGSEAQKQRWIGEATSDPTGEYLAGWTVSEAAGTPGGTANFDHPGAAPSGIALLATYDKGSGEYVLNGCKYWPCNAARLPRRTANQAGAAALSHQ
jgi:hypothetical protein